MKNPKYFENNIEFAKIIIDTIIKATNIIIHDIKKFIAPLITIDIGNISLGKYTFFSIPPLPTTIMPATATLVVSMVEIVTTKLSVATPSLEVTTSSLN